EGVQKGDARDSEATRHKRAPAAAGRKEVGGDDILTGDGRDAAPPCPGHGTLLHPGRLLNPPPQTCVFAPAVAHERAGGIAAGGSWRTAPGPGGNAVRPARSIQGGNG